MGGIGSSPPAMEFGPCLQVTPTLPIGESNLRCVRAAHGQDGSVRMFLGFFWAPDIIFMHGQCSLYYSCAGVGAPAAKGLATASNLAGPWSDQGITVAANNAIDPAMLRDGSNLWLTYGTWQSGVDLIQ